MLFFVAARLALEPKELRRVADKMVELGGQLDPEKISRMGIDN